MQAKLIWPWKWGLGKVLYLLTRYLAFIDITIFLICEYLQVTCSNNSSTNEIDLDWFDQSLPFTVRIFLILSTAYPWMYVLF